MVVLLWVLFFGRAVRVLVGDGGPDGFLVNVHDGEQAARKRLRGGLDGDFQPFYGGFLPVPVGSVQAAPVHHPLAQDVRWPIGLVAVGGGDVDGKADMGLGHRQGVDGKQVDEGHLECHGFPFRAAHLYAHGDHHGLVNAALELEAVVQQEGGLPRHHHHVGLGEGDQRGADDALDVLLVVQVFRFCHGLSLLSWVGVNDTLLYICAREAISTTH